MKINSGKCNSGRQDENSRVFLGLNVSSQRQLQCNEADKKPKAIVIRERLTRDSLERTQVNG